MIDDERLAAILRRFIATNANDHGYVALRRGILTDHEVVLDGCVEVDHEDAELLQRLIREAP